ncbi:MAG: rRNA maturation RNase YbeY [Holosporales bacterium]|nr:rRNA maturation RNase YbeY [Holosporales bacterium]
MNRVAIIIESDLWKEKGDFESWISKLQSVFDTTVKEQFNIKNVFLVNLLLTGNNEMQNLNNKFMVKNNTTNVLSFPQFAPEYFLNMPYNCSEIFLGDIALAYEKIIEESGSFGIEFFARCTHLFVHGILHLFGIGHKNEQEEKHMQEMEIKILEQFGIKKPYG